MYNIISWTSVFSVQIIATSWSVLSMKLDLTRDPISVSCPPMAVLQRSPPFKGQTHVPLSYKQTSSLPHNTDPSHTTPLSWTSSTVNDIATDNIVNKFKSHFVHRRNLLNRLTPKIIPMMSTLKDSWKLCDLKTFVELVWSKLISENSDH